MMNYNSANKVSLGFAQKDIATGSRPCVRIEGMGRPMHPIDGVLGTNHVMWIDDEGFVTHIYKIGIKYGQSTHGMWVTNKKTLEKEIRESNSHFEPADAKEAAAAIYFAHTDPSNMDQLENQSFEYFDEDDE